MSVSRRGICSAENMCMTNMGDIHKMCPQRTPPPLDPQTVDMPAERTPPPLDPQTVDIPAERTPPPLDPHSQRIGMPSK